MDGSSQAGRAQTAYQPAAWPELPPAPATNPASIRAPPPPPPHFACPAAITGALAGLAEYYGQGKWSGPLQEVNDVDYRPYLLKP